MLFATIPAACRTPKAVARKISTRPTLNRELDFLLADEDPHPFDPHRGREPVAAPHLDSAVVMERTYPPEPIDVDLRIALDLIGVREAARPTSFHFLKSYAEPHKLRDAALRAARSAMLAPSRVPHERVIERPQTDP